AIPVARGRQLCHTSSASVRFLQLPGWGSEMASQLPDRSASQPEGEGIVMATVCISYRRADSASISGRIYARLIGQFGSQNICKDVDNMPPGVKFGTYIQDALRQCAVVLVLIGRQWLAEETAGGRRRLDDPEDWVRTEIEAALALGLTVLPVLVE